MILSKVHITNYKQYIDEHTIPIPSAATIGVIGANGVGKTTLFEAIEWCLYNPSSIAAKDVRPRGRAGYTKVVVSLEVPSTGQQFLIERELKRSSTQASIYRVESDGDETIVVQGTKQVTDYVEKHLIGLSHSAFTATFFTRQKELSFFGDLGVTARRREVGKLLGLETIRAAQQDIGVDRSGAMNEAKVLRSRYESESQGRDFAGETGAATSAIAASRAELIAATASIDRAKAVLDAAERELAAQQALKDRDNTAARAVIELKGEMGRITESRQHLENDLNHLTEREKERAALLPIAGKTESLRQEDERLNDLRQIALHKRDLEQNLGSLDQRRRDALASIHASVTRSAPPSPLDGWHWHNQDSNDPVGGCSRLLDAIHRIDISVIERNADDLQRMRTIARDRDAARQKLETYRASRRALETQLEAFEQAGDPTAKLEMATKSISEIQRKESGFEAQLHQMDLDLKKTRSLAENLRKQHFDDVCPTCQRPFSEADARIVLGAFEAQIRVLTDDHSALQSQRKALHVELMSCERERVALEERAKSQATLRQRIEASTPYIDDVCATVNALDQELATALRAVNRSSPPSEQDIAEVNRIMQGWRRILDTRDGIERARIALTAIDDQIAAIRQEIASVGDIAYDEKTHHALQSEFRKAIQAQSTVIQIDRDLARRPKLETDLAQCTTQITTIATSIATTESERARIGFDPAKLTDVTNTVRTAREEERIAIERRHRIQTTLREAEHALEAIQKDQERIARLATDADARQREADRLDEMYREFTEFERFAAAWYAPRLSDITSDIVGDVTAGKYDQIVFDNNFGIEVYDGDEEKFSLETFSGGERDVIALAARIALSRVIGGQGAHPPGFLVLDEVFGSLDRERRTRLLEMLGAIISTGEHFRQIFMISHVDDVRTAPIFDELWLVSESADGSSELQNLTPGAEIGEL